ncbi:Secreted protein [Frankia canadensis]|uniref:Secreted protein n=1 Tax=Frankia canadensis TaxID=1836972 RepID=A0A2I2L1R6_9ACTN|nr:hypothetical protein [Frankia canadensis]SNQ51876.1 Secreted protein [Frankia canadensis]SOU59166.1 Secreted protein [Frankia canadensis]
MNTAVRLTAFGAALALVVAGAYGVGMAVGPVTTVDAGVGTAEARDAGHDDGHGGTAQAAASDQPGGLASSAGGYTFTPTDSRLTPGLREDFAFRILGPNGAPATAFDVEHDKRMHLIVVRRDGTGFQHVHPDMTPEGTWVVPLTVPAAGSYRAFADFTPTGGAATTLGVDLTAPGLFEPVIHAPTRVATVDGYEVTLTGDLTGGQATSLTVTVRRDGRPVTDLEPYLGAYGHLVALREGDLAYLHVHPEGGPGDEHSSPGPDVQFVAEVPSAGSYWLFLDFQHGGIVRTAEFTVPTGPAVRDATAAPPPTGHDNTDHGHGSREEGWRP